MADFVWIRNPNTGEEERVSYNELDTDIYPQLFKPLGGFCYPVGSFVRLDLPKVPYYVRGWLPKQGKAMLYAPAKSGKSYLSYQLARCIAQGDDFLGMPTSRGRVLILQFELGEEVVQSRLCSTGMGYEDVYIGTSFSMKLDTTKGQQKFSEAVEAVEPRVVIIDPFYKIIKGDENEAHDVSAITDFLDEKIEEYGCSVFIFHHPGKDITKGGRGSSVLEGWVDSYLEMRKVKSKHDSDLHVRITPKLLRHAELPDEAIEATMKRFEFELGSPPTIQELVRDYFMSHPKKIITMAELVEAGLGSRKSVNNAREVLIKEGVVKKLEYGQYQLASGG